MRWPQNAVSLIGRAGKLSPGKTYKLMRAPHKHALNCLDQLWMLTFDRGHEKDSTALVAELKADWCRVQKLPGRSRVKAGNLMPGWWVIVQQPADLRHHTSADQVDPALSIASQRRLPTLHRQLLLPCPGPTDDCQTRNRSPDRPSSSPDSDAADVPPSGRR